jgi:hypothetical protein
MLYPCRFLPEIITKAEGREIHRQVRETREPSETSQVHEARPVNCEALRR